MKKTLLAIAAISVFFGCEPENNTPEEPEDVVSFPQKAIDLGLIITREDGTKYNLVWAECNIGANAPEEYGDYYAWGEVEAYYSSKNPFVWKKGKEAGYYWASYKWGDVSAHKLTKYCPIKEEYFWDGGGAPDGKMVLDTGPKGDDVASRALGGKWRMPTDAEFRALKNKCEYKWDTKNGVKGMYFSSKAEGNTNSIFLPAALSLYETFLSDSVDPYGNDITFGYYWSSTLDSAQSGCKLGIEKGAVTHGGIYRFIGASVRAVWAVEITE